MHCRGREVWEEVVFKLRPEKLELVGRQGPGESGVGQLSSSMQAAIPKCHRVAYKKQKFVSHYSGAGKSKIKAKTEL